jgi:hypothetical protein
MTVNFSNQKNTVNPHATEYCFGALEPSSVHHGNMRDIRLDIIFFSVGTLDLEGLKLPDLKCVDRT